jgi:UDP-N-acetylmuramoyl-L-alanyl-D-glutamate--2,6-diaminopimelate ligase
MRLFTSLDDAIKEDRESVRIAILNGDDPSHDFIVESLRDQNRVETRSYGIGGRWEISATEVNFNGGCPQFTVNLGETSIDVASRLPGTYNVSNCLAAIGATVYALGIPMKYAKKAIENSQGIPGRMEYITLGQEFNAIVDFAHTPNALEKVLDAVRTTNFGRIITVFGSAGLRDQIKRQMMAEISATKADISILTAEDPRTESLSDILEEMTAAAERSGAVLGKSLYIQPDRRDAIRQAIHLAKKGDTVLLCGKGHEQSMCFGEVEYPWDDRIALKAALAEELGVEGLEMPFLPSVR